MTDKELIERLREANELLECDRRALILSVRTMKKTIKEQSDLIIELLDGVFPIDLLEEESKKPHLKLVVNNEND